MSEQARAPRDVWPWIAAIALLFAAAAVLRWHNALHYFPNFGFDAEFNWDYIRKLTHDWALPEPESMWSAARPPLFFYVGAALARAFGPMLEPSVHAIRLSGSALGLVAVGLVVRFVWRAAPDGPRCAVLAAALLLFLPAHIYMSAMLNEEVMVAALTTATLWLALAERFAPARPGRPPAWWRTLGIGVLGGLALLTKLTGALVVVAVCLAIVIDGLRARRVGAALRRAAAIVAVALVVGGWFYARNLWLHGYIYPSHLEAHAIMLSMPPGARSVGDYVNLPLATFRDPRMNSPDLLHSVWGGTWATLWFDGQRHFVPRSDPNVTRMGTLITLLALLPGVAFFVGAWRALQRALRAPGTVETPMLLLVALTLAGYILYTWQNPWYATVKGSYLLGLALPFGWWSSDALCAWMRRSRWLAALIWIDCAALVVAAALAFTFGTPLWEMVPGRDMPGLPWLPGQP